MDGNEEHGKNLKIEYSQNVKQCINLILNIFLSLSIIYISQITKKDEKHNVGCKKTWNVTLADLGDRRVPDYWTGWNSAQLDYREYVIKDTQYFLPVSCRLLNFMVNVKTF